MKPFSFSKTAALLAVLSPIVVAATVSSAMAMPVGSIPVPGDGSALQRVVDGHRIYPGSESATAQKARDERNAPNRFCEKQQQYCE